MCKRCAWVDNNKPDYVDYHDREWGVPVYDDKKMFEFLLLESAQAGLSWYTILRRREGYRRAFADFDVHRVAQFTHGDIERLLQDGSIIRNRAKIEAAVNNAQRFIEIQQEFGSFCRYIWGFVNNQVIVNDISSPEACPATSAVSDELAKDMKKRGFKFIGSTIMYAHLQATGLVNDHENGCYRKQQVRLEEDSSLL